MSTTKLPKIENSESTAQVTTDWTNNSAIRIIKEEVLGKTKAYATRLGKEIKKKFLEDYIDEYVYSANSSATMRRTELIRQIKTKKKEEARLILKRRFERYGYPFYPRTFKFRNAWTMYISDITGPKGIFEKYKFDLKYTGRGVSQNKKTNSHMSAFTGESSKNTLAEILNKVPTTSKIGWNYKEVPYWDTFLKDMDGMMFYDLKTKVAKEFKEFGNMTALNREVPLKIESAKQKLASTNTGFAEILANLFNMTK